MDISPGSISPGNVSNLLLKTASAGELTPSLAASLFNYPCCWKSASLTRCVTWLSSPCDLLCLCLRDWKLLHLLPVIKSPLSLSLINSLSFMSKVLFAIWGHFGSFPLNFCWYSTCWCRTQDPHSSPSAVCGSTHSTQLQLVFILMLGHVLYPQYCNDLLSRALWCQLMLCCSEWSCLWPPLRAWLSKGAGLLWVCLLCVLLCI